MRRRNGANGRRQREAEKWERETALRIAEREAELASREAERKLAEESMAHEVERRLHTLRIEHQANRLLTEELTRSRAITLPEPGFTAEEFLDEDESEPEAVIEELHYRGNNTLLVAEYKTGKTTLALNLAAALADGTPFLDRFDVNMPYGRVAFLNYEMDARQFRSWLRERGVSHLDRIVPLNLRGWMLPFWTDETMNKLSYWLLENRIGFVILDPAARAWRGLVENEGDNVQLAEFFGALDELKRLADVSNLLITTHKPRSNEDRARGGGEIEAWPDSNWYLSKDKEGVRSMRAEGRDVLLPATDLGWDEDRKLLTAIGETETRRAEIAIEEMTMALQAHGEIGSTTALCDLLSGKTSYKRKWIADAVENGIILKRRDGRSDVYSLPE